MYAYTSIPDEKEIGILRSLCAENLGQHIIFFDIGANIGSYSISMLDLCDEIIAFEPHPYAAKRCKMNFLLNSVSETNIKQFALSNEIGEVYFSDYKNDSTVNHITDKTSKLRVAVTTLDNFVFQNNFLKEYIYILKIDVEGFERQVLEGGREFLTNYHNIKGIVFECFNKDDVFKLLMDYGYTNIKRLSKNNYFAKK
jgi:FkbM family methyltransferase